MTEFYHKYNLRFHTWYYGREAVIILDPKNTLIKKANGGYEDFCSNV
jgi:hypothetical protein